MRQIEKLTDARIIRAFFGEHAKPYDYTVTDDDFDEHDNAGPGHYYGVDVPDDMADRWDVGILACRTAGVHVRSAEGMALRYEAMHGTRMLPAKLVEVVREREEKEAAKMDAAQHETAEKVRRQSILAGKVRLALSDSHVDAICILEPILTRIGITDCVFPRVDGLEKLWDTGDEYMHRHTYYRLSTGDIMQCAPGINVSLWTGDREIITAYRDALVAVGCRDNDYYGRYIDEAETALAAM